MKNWGKGSPALTKKKRIRCADAVDFEALRCAALTQGIRLAARSNSNGPCRSRLLSFSVRRPAMSERSESNGGGGN